MQSYSEDEIAFTAQIAFTDYVIAIRSGLRYRATLPSPAAPPTRISLITH